MLKLVLSSGSVLASTVGLAPRTTMNRFLTVRGRLRANACLALASLMLSGGSLCVACAVSEQSHWCCSSRFAHLSEAIPSVGESNQLSSGEHRCRQQQHGGKSGSGDERPSSPIDKKQCCWRESQTVVPATLLQSIAPRTTWSNHVPQADAIQASAQPTGFNRRVSVTNRGSTYLLFCVLLI